MQKSPLNILEVSSSGRRDGSVSRQLSTDLITALEDRHGAADIYRRDVAAGLPFVDDDWIAANFTPAEMRTDAQHAALAFSDHLVGEIQAADVLVIGVPIYNFTIAASLKAWIDLIARARLTFSYSDTGPVGLLTGKKAYLLVATGGVPVGSPMDFATPYLRQALSFVGIDDIEIIAADGLNSNADEAIDRARTQIADVIHLAEQVA